MFIDHYNFHRPHQGVGGAVPADRYFEAAAEVKATLLARVASNAEELARNGVPRKPFYLTGRVGDRDISLHAEGEKVVLMEGGQREEVDLGAPGRRVEPSSEPTLPEPVAVTAVVADATDLDDDGQEVAAPGTSPLDAGLSTISRVMAPPSRPDPTAPVPPTTPPPPAPRAPYAPGGASEADRTQGPPGTLASDEARRAGGGAAGDGGRAAAERERAHACRCR